MWKKQKHIKAMPLEQALTLSASETNIFSLFVIEDET